MHTSFLLIILLLFIEFFLIIYCGWRILRPVGKTTSRLYVAITLLLSLLFVAQFYLLRSGVIPHRGGHLLYKAANAWLAVAFYQLVFMACSEGVLYLLSKIRKIDKKRLRPRFFLGAWLVTGLIAVIGYFNYTTTHITRYEVSLAKPLSPLKVAFVSDLHLGYGGNRLLLHQQIDTLLAQHPDLIVVAGDLIDNSVPAARQDSLLKELTRLSAPLGVYMALGNHEYISDVDSSIAYIRESGIILLRDSVVTLPNGLQLVGRDDSFNADRRALIELSMDTIYPRLLIEHKPQDLQEAAQAGIDLQVSGHTHRGQIFPFNLLADRLFPVSYGRAKEKEMELIVSSGLSLWGPPFRLGTQSEIVLIELSGTDPFLPMSNH